MVYVILCLSVFVPPLPFLLVILKIDPFYIMKQAFWNESPLICSSNPCFPEIFIRLALTSLFFYVVTKFIFMDLYILSLLINHVRNYCNTLDGMQGRLSNNLLLEYYFRVLVFIRNTDQFTSDLMLYFIIFGQILLTFFAWMIVHCRELLPVFIIAACANLFVGGIFLSIFILRVAAYVQAYSSELVDKKRAQFFGRDCRKLQYYFTAKWRAYKKARIGFGSRFVISKDSINVYVEVLTNNITDSVLLVIP